MHVEIPVFELMFEMAQLLLQHLLSLGIAPIIKIHRVRLPVVPHLLVVHRKFVAVGTRPRHY